jgi:hypothetical protein
MPVVGLRDIPEARPLSASAHPRGSPAADLCDEDKVVGAQRCELAEASVEGILMAWRGRVVMQEKFQEMVGDG